MNKSQILVILGALFALMIYNSTVGTNRTKIMAQFEQFKFRYSRSYQENQQIYRFKIFSENLDRIQKHNSDRSQTYKMGITEFTDMTTQEFTETILMNGLKKKLESQAFIESKIEGTVSDSIDWRNSSVLNPIKNQGQCGSCWAFSTTGALESNIAVATKKLNNFSEQQLVDCCGSKGFECLGCNGAWPEWALNYVGSYGIVLQSDYPYTAKVGECKPIPSAKKYLNTAKPWTMVSPQNITQIQKAVSSTGPVSICVDASNWAFYKSGVFSNCGYKNLNHAVLLVGYQTDGTWIVRNSWGSNWGEQGYIRLSPGGTCGLNQHVVIPNLA